MVLSLLNFFSHFGKKYIEQVAKVVVIYPPQRGWYLTLP